MKPLFSEEQLNNMSCENLIELMQTLHAHQEKQDQRIQLLEDKNKDEMVKEIV